MSLVQSACYRFSIDADSHLHLDDQLSHHDAPEFHSDSILLFDDHFGHAAT